MFRRSRVPLTLLSAFLFCLVLPRRGAAQDCEHAAERSATTQASGIERVRVIAHAGSLEVTGRPGAGQVAARGHACASDEDDLDELTIRVSRDGSTLVVEATAPDDGMHFGDYYARLDLTVEVPQGIDLRVEDGSGEMSVTGVGAASVTDGSGSISISDVRGSLDLSDGSGEIVISGVAGDVDIEDGSGEIRITNVRGDVEVEDGSGDVLTREVGGSVRVEDGSGDIRITNVTRSVMVDDGSGSIRVERIGGDFIVDDDGSGEVSYGDVTGRVRVPDDD